MRFSQFQYSHYITSNEHISGSTEDIFIIFALLETGFQALKYTERISFSEKFYVHLIFTDHPTYFYVYRIVHICILQDVLVVVNVKIELDPLFPTQDGANIYQAIVNLSSPDCTVLVS